MIRPWVLISVASTALLAIIVFTRHSRSEPSATVGRVTDQAARSTQDDLIEPRSSGAGWIAKPGAGEARSGGAVPGAVSTTQRGSGGVRSGRSVGDSVSANVVAGGSRSSSVIGGGRNRPPDGAEPIGVRGSLASA